MESVTYVGLDVHKSVVVATAMDATGRRIDQRKLGPTDDELTKYLRQLPGDKRVALEATTVGALLRCHGSRRGYARPVQPSEDSAHRRN